MSLARLYFPETAADLDALLESKIQKPARVYVDQHTAPLLERLGCLTDLPTTQLPSGESVKSMETIQDIWRELLDDRAPRNITLIVLGGGALTDAVGFAAATYKRGCAVILIPTTLLGMVDAAIGGKTAINFGGVKNSIGAFHHANEVIIWQGFLETLPAQQLREGFAEVIKTGLLAGGSLWQMLCAGNIQSNTLAEIIQGCARYKSEIVAKDPRETGIRGYLNFGHTVAHALEAGLKWSHGEAVATGILIESYLTQPAGPTWQMQAQALLREHASLRTLPESLDLDRLWILMQNDKKSLQHQVRFTGLLAPGQPEINMVLTREKLEAALQRYNAMALS